MSHRDMDSQHRVRNETCAVDRDCVACKLDLNRERTTNGNQAMNCLGAIKITPSE